MQGGTSFLYAGHDLQIVAGNLAGSNAQMVGTYIDARAGNDIVVQANGGSALLSQTSNNYSTQNVQATNDIRVTGGSLGVTGATATINSLLTGGSMNAGNDLLIQAGTADGARASIVTAGSQYVYANNLSVLGGGDNAHAVLQGNYQDMQRVYGNVVVQGGTGAASYAEVVATGSSQYIGSQYTYYYNPTDSVLVQGGSGAGSYASIKAAGYQEVQAGISTGTGNISVMAGGGVGANAEIVSLTGGQTIGGTSTYYYVPTNSILVQASGTGTARIKAAGSQTISGDGNISVLGGSAIGMDASIESTGGSQTIGSSTSYYYSTPTDNILVQAGAGGSAYIRALGSQNVQMGGNLSVLGGSGPGTTAFIESTGSSQNVGYTYIYSNDPNGNVTVQAGSGSGAAAWIKAATGQTIDAGGNISVTAGGPGAFAEIVTTAGSQTIGNINNYYYDQTDVISLQGGNGANAWAKIGTGGTQNVLSANGITMAGGAGDLSGALMLAGTGQTVTTYGALSMTGGSGSAPGMNETAIRNSTSGSQTVTVSGNIAMSSGGFGSDTWIKQGGTSLQTVSAGGALTLQSLTANTGVTSIESGAGGQFISAGDVITVDNQAGWITYIASGGDQTINAQSMSINLASASGAAPLAGVVATGIQTVLLSGGVDPASLTITNASAAAGSTAKMTAGGNQVISLFGPKYTNAGKLQIGDVNGQGASLVQAGGAQTIVAGELLVQGGATVAAKASLLSTGAILISTLNGPIQVLGGVAGAAEIDPPTLDAVSNGSIIVAGGTATSASASVTADFINMTATNGNMAVIGGAALPGGVMLPPGVGTGLGAASITALGTSVSGSVTTPGTFSFTGSGNAFITPNSAGATITALGGININVPGFCFVCAAPNLLVTDPLMLVLTVGSLSNPTPPLANIDSNILYAFSTDQVFGFDDLYQADDGTWIFGSRRRGLNQCY